MDALSDTLEIREMAVQVRADSTHLVRLYDSVSPFFCVSLSLSLRFFLLSSYLSQLLSEAHGHTLAHQLPLDYSSDSNISDKNTSNIWILQDGFNGGSNADQAARGLSKEERAAERIAAIRTAVVHGGPLSMKSAKTGLFKSGWKDRYFVIASGNQIISIFLLICSQFLRILIFTSPYMSLNSSWIDSLNLKLIGN